jgi:hypothetical protein
LRCLAKESEAGHKSRFLGAMMVRPVGIPQFPVFLRIRRDKNLL